MSHPSSGAASDRRISPQRCTGDAVSAVDWRVVDCLEGGREGEGLRGVREGGVGVHRAVVWRKLPCRAMKK